MTKYYGVLFTRKSGKIVKTLEGKGCGLLKLYGVQGNVSPSRDYVVFNGENGEIVFYCEGKKDDSPTIHKEMEGRNIEELCEGMLESLNG